MRNHTLGAVALAALMTTATTRAQDAEKAAHGDEAATPQISYERRAGDVLLRQYQLGCLSQLTYLIVSGGEALVVDPQRDVDHYLRDAKALGAQIKYVALTHTNADFVAGHTELAARAGAQILISAESGSEFPHRGMQDKESVTVGAARIEFIATPGHTFDAMSLLVHVPRAADVEADPLWVLTGDALFIGSIGRPDLAQGEASPMTLASRAFDSVQRFATLPDATIVLPSHGAGSLCGAHLSPDTSSTIGREKIENPYFQIKSRAAFIARDVSGLAPAPQYFAYNVALNRKGPPVVDWTAEMPRALTPADVKQALRDGAWIVDLRPGREYSKAHIEGSINVSVRGRLDTWTGIVIPFTAPLVLVGSPDEVREAAFRFKRIGLDHVVGHLATDIEGARAAGLTIRSAELVSPAALAQRIAHGDEPILVDVRTAEEHAELAIGEYAHIELTNWEHFGEVLDRDMPVLFVCNSAYRSSMAVGLAERLGFRHVSSLEGGLDAWLDAGLPVYGTASVCAGPVCPAPGASVKTSTPSVAGAVLTLPEPIEPLQLAALLLDQPRGFAIYDVRPAWQYDEYHLPGALNVAPGEVLAHVKSLPRTTRIVIVDRDGTIAWAVAGAVLGELGADFRSVRVVAGGTARFWREVEIAGQAVPAALGAQSVPTTTPAPPPTAPAKPAPKKRSAGC
ncbi:MAG: MBL fold metallo-hydrolase [Planctomycetes bacterium]|nr:MBL fold metallo-hydrolase [Planctomycetota bacterium]